jgi:hypothetical protein
VAGSGCLAHTYSSDACMHHKLEKARKEIWDRPDDQETANFGGTASGEVEVGKAWIMATGVGLLGNELRDNETERVERNDG